MAGPPVAQPRITALAARHPQVVDIAVGAFFALLYLLSIRSGRADSPHPGRALLILDYAAAAVTFGLIAVRRRHPRAVLAAAVAAATASMVAGESRAAPAAAAAIAAYTVATTWPRRTAWLCGGSAAVLLYSATLVWPGPALPGASWWERGEFGVLAGIGMAVALGDTIRTRRAYVTAVEERARRAEQSREEETQRRVIEERLRIARELHDVVAHNLALISVQAGVATYLMTSRPEKAATALTHVRQAANTAVQELGTVLAVLRKHSDTDEPTEPAAGLSHLPQLFDNMAAAGLRVQYRQLGTARAVPAAVDLAAYRIIQESLTNAHKHTATGTAHLSVSYTAEGITIDVTNPFGSLGDGHATSAVTGTGHGLIGMRERAAAVGGTLHAGLAMDNTFSVHAVIPARDPEGSTR